MEHCDNWPGERNTVVGVSGSASSGCWVPGVAQEGRRKVAIASSRKRERNGAGTGTGASQASSFASGHVMTRRWRSGWRVRVSCAGLSIEPIRGSRFQQHYCSHFEPRPLVRGSGHTREGRSTDGGCLYRGHNSLQPSRLATPFQELGALLSCRFRSRLSSRFLFLSCISRSFVSFFPSYLVLILYFP